MKKLIKTLLFAAFISIPLLFQAQVIKNQRFYVPKSESIESIVKRLYPSFIEVELWSEIKSPHGNHTTYNLLLNGVHILHTSLKVNDFDLEQKIITTPLLPNLASVESHPQNFKLAYRFFDQFISKEDTVRLKSAYLITGNALQPVYQCLIESAISLDEYISSIDGKILNTNDLSLHAKPDSLIEVNVFRPDPITSAETEYGGNFEDYQDSNVAIINYLLERDSIYVRWDSVDLVWILRSDFARARIIGEPNIAPPTSKTGIFDFERGDSGFEFVNAFYHLNKEQHFIRALGFENLVDYPIPFDAYGDLRDQSSFIASTTNPRLVFGIGGVDDAEDADVIIHEFGHAVSYSAAPQTNFGDERQALDEGFCDYLAYSYSKKISDYQVNRIFNWDGHNEFWPGRTIPQNRTYPSDLKENIYSDGLLWTSALSEISDLIGDTITDQLAIQTLYAFYENMSFTDAGYFLLKSDSVMFDAVHADEIYFVLCYKGLFAGCEDTLVTTLPLSEPYLGNTQLFFEGNESLTVFPNKTIIKGYSIYSTDGKLIENEDILDNLSGFIEITPGIKAAGIFVLTLHTSEGDFSFKILKAER